MKVGDKVLIDPSEFPFDEYDEESNPVGVIGVITYIAERDEFGDLNVHVDFVNGQSNAYEERHLITVN